MLSLWSIHFHHSRTEFDIVLVRAEAMNLPVTPVSHTYLRCIHMRITNGDPPSLTYLTMGEPLYDIHHTVNVDSLRLKSTNLRWLSQY